jgi:4-hydroxythreonine-4-phosphate dehydrogenase
MAPSISPAVAISMGDPAGIGCEIILKSAAALAQRPRTASIMVLGDLGAMRAAHRAMRGSVPEPYEWRPGEALRPLAQGLAVRNLSELRSIELRPGRPSIAGADAAYQYIIEGCRMARAGVTGALVTAPINKEWLNRAGHHYPGHSELIADYCGARLWRMMFVGERLRVALATVHIGLMKIGEQLSVQGIFDTIRLFHEHLRERAGMPRARIAVLGLNPHAGEGGLFGDEEARLITPAIKRAQRAGIGAFGPLAPDTAFVLKDGEFNFDGAVAMYHDQGLIALKTLEFDRAVNLTLGLPFVRTSPDHGTAYDIAGRGVANPASMLAAIEYAMAAVRRAKPRRPAPRRVVAQS